MLISREFHKTRLTPVIAQEVNPVDAFFTQLPPHIGRENTHRAEGLVIDREELKRFMPEEEVRPFM